jgi:RNA polymerase sigma-70 factor (ECF subfamily)
LRKKNPAKANLFSGIDLNHDSTSTSFVDRNTPSHSLEQKEVAEELFKAIDNLPEMQKKAFLLHKFEDHSHKEICEILSITKASVESLIYRAKSNLRKSLLDYFNTNFI